MHLCVCVCVCVCVSRSECGCAIVCAVSSLRISFFSLLLITKLQLSIISTCPYRQLLDQCKELELECLLQTPTQWTGKSHWQFNITLVEPTIHYLNIHIPFFKALIDNFAGVATPYDSDLFTPIEYGFNIKGHNTNLLWCVNRYNCILVPREPPSASSLLEDVDQRNWDNVMLNFLSRNIEVSFGFGYDTFGQTSSTVTYKIDAHNLNVSLLMPEWNTIRLYTKNLSKVAAWDIDHLGLNIKTMDDERLATSE